MILPQLNCTKCPTSQWLGEVFLCTSRDQDHAAAGNPRNVHIPHSERDTARQIAQKNNQRMHQWAFFPNDEKSHDTGGCATFISSKIWEKWSESVKNRAT